MSDSIIPLTRKQLAAFLPDARAVRLFENLIAKVNSLSSSNSDALIALIQEAAISAANADAKAIQSLDALERIASALEQNNAIQQAQINRISDDAASDHKELELLMYAPPVVIPEATTGGSTSPGGSSGQIQYNNAGAFAGAANVEISGDDLVLANNVANANPPANKTKLAAEKVAGLETFGALNSIGRMTLLQQMISRKKIAWWNPSGRTTTAPVVWGMLAVTVAGTATARTPTTTSVTARKKRIGYASSSTVSSMCGIHVGSSVDYTTGSATGGGFYCVIEFVAATDTSYVSGARAFTGLRAATAAPTNVDPATLTNVIGVCKIASSTNLHLLIAGSDTSTPIDLGANFSELTSGNITAFRLTLTSYYDASTNETVFWQIENLENGAVASGSKTRTTTDVPTSTTLLGPAVWRTNNLTTSVAAVDVVNIYIEAE